jgi:hypothetical protein
MSSSDYTALRKIKQIQTRPLCSICINGSGVLCSLCSAGSACYPPPGFNSIGRTGATGATGATGTFGPPGPAGPPGLSLEYNLFLAYTTNGILVKNPNMSEPQTSISFTMPANNVDPHLIGEFTTNLISSMTSPYIVPGLWDLNLYANIYASAGQMTTEIAICSAVFYINSAGTETLIVDATSVATPILSTMSPQRYTNSFYVPYYTLPDLSGNIKIKIYAFAYDYTPATHILTMYFNPPTLSYLRTTLANQLMPKGPTGATGGMGRTGARGLMGAIGWTGATGPQGINGMYGGLILYLNYDTATTFPVLSPTEMTPIVGYTVEPLTTISPTQSLVSGLEMVPNLSLSQITITIETPASTVLFPVAQFAIPIGSLNGYPSFIAQGIWEMDVYAKSDTGANVGIRFFLLGKRTSGGSYVNLVSNGSGIDYIPNSASYTKIQPRLFVPADISTAAYSHLVIVMCAQNRAPDSYTAEIAFQSSNTYSCLRTSYEKTGATGTRGETGATGATGATGMSQWSLSGTTLQYNGGNVSIGNDLSVGGSVSVEYITQF